MSMQLVFTQILVILLYVAVGFVAGRTRLILPEQRRTEKIRIRLAISAIN